jgi:hypothetical protein
MKRIRLLLCASLVCLTPVLGTTIMVVPIHEPISLHGTDGDEVISEVGEALQAAVLPRPMALTGAFPEVLAESIATPHRIPTNNPNYEVAEANLLVLCKIGVHAVMKEDGLHVRLDVSQLAIPEEVDLTSRQLLRLAIIALRKTLEDYQRPQTDALTVRVTVTGAEDAKASLRDLAVQFTLGGPPAATP